MKILSLFTFLMMFQISFSQLNQNNINGFDFVERLKAKGIDNNDYGDVKGSMYLSDLNPIRISIIKNKILLGRYNAFSGEIEVSVSNNDKPFVLSKDLESYKVEFVNQKKIYQNYSYSENGVSKKSFLVNVSIKENISLLKKETIKLAKGKKAKNGYEIDKPDEFKRSKDVYFLKLKDQTIIEAPTKKKEFVKLFTKNEKRILEFIKKEKIKINNEDNLVELVNFLDSIQ